MSLIPFGFWSGQQNIITSNLIFYYDPANPSSYPGSGTTLTDLSGNSYTATLRNGVGFNSGDGGGSFTFNGTNQDILVPNGSAASFINQSFTIQFWLKPSDSFVVQEEIFFSINQDATTGSRLHCRLYGFDRRLRFAFYSDDLDTANNVVTLGNWVLVTMRYRSSDDTATIFANTTQLAQGNNGPLLSSIGREVIIGSWGPFGQYWVGSMGAMYAYQNALTDAQIISNYNTLKSRYGL